MEIFKNIATVVGCISACIALLLTIIKPLRQHLISSFSRQSQSNKVVIDVKELNNKIDTLLRNNKDLIERLDRVEIHVLENESDRLKAELSNYYNRCCRNLQIFPEEMLRVEEVYDRYHNQLGLNHVGTNMYDAIAQYYKQQDFIKMNKN